MDTIKEFKEQLIYINGKRGASTGIVVERDLQVLSLEIEIEKVRQLGIIAECLARIWAGIENGLNG